MAVLAAIEWDKLFEVVWVSMLAGIGVTGFYSLIIYGGSRAAEARRAGNGGAATAYGALAIFSFAVFAAGLIFGVAIILSK
jgi:hypothetical protein